MVKLDRCIGNCNVINNLSNEGCVPCKTGDLNLSVFNIITGINESKNQQSIFHVNVNANELRSMVK